MKNEIEKIKTEIKEKIKTPTGISQIMTQILELTDEIPFGNSDFQNKISLIECELFPHRAYKMVALKIIDRLSALSECYYNLKEKEIEIKKLQRQLEKETDELEKELIQIKIEKILNSFPYTKKLIKDAIHEIDELLPFLLSIGKISRKEFEEKEQEYFKTKIKIQEKLGSIEKYIIEQNNNLFLFNQIVNQNKLNSE